MVFLLFFNEIEKKWKNDGHNTIHVHTLLLFANCSNWCKNDVICGWNELYGVWFTWCDCNAPNDTAVVVRDASGLLLLICDWPEAGVV